MLKKIKHLILGESLRSDALAHEKFSVLWGLPVLSSDAISSVSYACEEILMVLIPVMGLASYGPLMKVGFAIVFLLFILVFSYRQTINCYPQGGGSYIVASDNLGKVFGLIAASSLAIDYVLTVAVSVCAGTAAITSAFPQLLSVRTEIALLIITLLTIGNLRGMKDSSILFGIPTYLFVFTILLMILTGFVKVFVFHEIPNPPAAVPGTVESLSLLLFLKAFSSGCTALTGVEAVSDGIPNFRAPAQKNAKRVLYLLAALVFIIFLGILSLASVYHIVPHANVTVIAMIAEEVFGKGTLLFYLVQITTAIILTMAANTAFADLPLLLSILARDGFVPRQFLSRGSRLSFSNGILLLFLLSAALVIAFHASSHLLMPLYAVGVFLSFTLSQAGMFVRWMKRKEGNWRHKAVINGSGMLITAITCVIIAASKFMHGAWIVLLCIPVLVYLMERIHRHYAYVKESLKIRSDQELQPCAIQSGGKVILPVDSINRSFLKAYHYACSLQVKQMEFYHVNTNAEAAMKLQAVYEQMQLNIPLVMEEAPYRNVNEMILQHVRAAQKDLKPKESVTVILPQFVMKKKRFHALHNQTSMQLKLQLSKLRNVSVISVPYIM
ncbi:APC family permease [[Clostridium] innocuum]|uniref:APC family permease n=1 Tax=Clostridium innocuum TaxID=1522 RepID=UPI001AF904F5|nr:APC family permease [[Clostridium] innocuum]QSI24487.1 amino acid permease [Erysipelotrichaceae bacterium 66202529]MCC2834514.1 APC family permease [[Clostridium] innocuum]MCR0247456.1 APC family permease [[Clostridium] innocuum]MCR0260134.1 APC family permease [[Clostridium] innocuum]MCR0390432.1 APC family permease [[Clostridium] innocuum]